MNVEFLQPILIFGVSALLGYLLAFPTGRLLTRFGVVDHPSARSSHTQPTIRGGGIAILGAMSVVSLWLLLESAKPLMVFLAAALLLAIISFWDDLKSVPPVARFGCHSLAALAALAALGWPIISIRETPFGALTLPYWLSLALLFLWLTGHTNAFNFMDGINGLATGQALITSMGMALLSGIATGQWNQPALLFSLALAGAAAGFLPHNFPRARMFMGDVGSAPLGFLLASQVCWLGLANGGILLVPLLLLHANFALDTSFTLVRRILRGEQWHKPHREHFYQRLTISGKSHKYVTGLEMGLQFLVLILMLLYLYTNSLGRWGLTATVLLIWLIFFGICEHSWRTHCASAGSLQNSTS